MKEWKHKCELQLLVCEPNPLRPDRVTVGFVLRDTRPDTTRVEVRLAKDLRNIRCIYPDADLEAIQGTLFEMESVLKNVTDFENFLQHLPADFPGDFALLPGRAVLTDSMEAEVALLEQQYIPGQGCETPNERRTTVSPPYGRPYILRKMQEAFRQFDVLNYLATDIPVDQYTTKGDPLVIDFGYARQHHDTYRMLHAVSVVTNPDKARILELSWPEIQRGVQRETNRECEMFAIMEDAPFNQSARAHMIRGWMESKGIVVQPLSAMVSLALEAKKGLGV